MTKVHSKTLWRLRNLALGSVVRVTCTIDRDVAENERDPPGQRLLILPGGGISTLPASPFSQGELKAVFLPRIARLTIANVVE